MLLAEEACSLEIPLMLDEWRHLFFQLAALVDVIAAAQHNLGAFEPQPLTLILFHAHCFAHHTPRCVDMPQSSNSTYSEITDHLTSALALEV